MKFIEENNPNKNNLKEASKSSSFFYSKDNPSVLITDEMLERVPKLYGQEKVKLSEK